MKKVPETPPVTCNKLLQQNTKISRFETCLEITPTIITLGEWILLSTTEKDPKLVSLIKEIRKIEQAKYRAQLKLRLPAVTPSAHITTRAENIPMQEKVVCLSGYMQFDIDLKDNPHIEDAAWLRDELKDLKYVYYSSISASGRGVWGLIKVKYPEKLQYHFDQFNEDMAACNIFLDTSKGGKPTDLRFYSWDKNAYLNYFPKVYENYLLPEPMKEFNEIRESARTRKTVEDLITIIVEKDIDIAPEYDQYLKIGFAFADEFGEAGRSRFHAVCSPYPKYTRKQTDIQYDKCLKSNTGETSIGTFFFYCKEKGIWIS